MPIFDPQVIVLATLLASLVLFVTDTVRYDVVALLVVLVLAASGVLEPREAFEGFASPAVVLIASMYVFGLAISKTGVAEFIGQKILGRGRGGEAALTVRVVLVSGLLSSVLSNTGVVAALIPVLSSVAQRRGLPISRLLMPLAFGSLLGGMVTVIGTSTNIAVNEAIEKLHGTPFGLFEFSLFGLLCLGVGALYFATPFRKLLPRSRIDETLSEHYHVPEFVSEVLVTPSCKLVNRTVDETGLHERFEIAVLAILRPGEPDILTPNPYLRIRSDDTLILQGESANLVRLRRELGLRKRETIEAGDLHLESPDMQLVEAVVPAVTNLVGRTLAQADFRASTGLNALAIAKYHHHRPTGVSEQRLAVGDTLLIQGSATDIERARRSRQLLILGELELPVIGRGALVTLGILTCLLAVVALGWMHLAVAALAGAVALVASRTVRPDEVRRTIDWSVLILIGGMLSLGVAFSKVHLGEELASWVTHIGGAAEHPSLLLLIVMGATVVLTQVMNHVTSAVVMTPVAMSFADSLEVNQRTFLMAVIVGANLAFLSPVAHQANAMVMGPGDYKYRDFLRLGTPLTLILMAVATLLLPVMWPFAGP